MKMGKTTTTPETSMKSDKKAHRIMWFSWPNKITEHAKTPKARHQERAFVKCSCVKCALIGHRKSGASRTSPNSTEHNGIVCAHCPNHIAVLLVWLLAPMKTQSLYSLALTRALSLSHSLTHFVHSLRVAAIVSGCRCVRSCHSRIALPCTYTPYGVQHTNRM